MARKPDTVSLDDLAKLFRRSTETIRKWRKLGLPCRMDGDRPRFVVEECITWREEHIREEERSKVVDLDEAKERARKLHAEADIKEDERDERRGKLVPVDAYRSRLEEFVGGFAATAAGRLHRFERDIVQCTTPAGARKLTQDIHEALMRGAQEYADTIEALAAAEEEAA